MHSSRDLTSKDMKGNIERRHWKTRHFEEKIRMTRSSLAQVSLKCSQTPSALSFISSQNSSSLCYSNSQDDTAFFVPNFFFTLLLPSHRLFSLSWHHLTWIPTCVLSISLLLLLKVLSQRGSSSSLFFQENNSIPPLVGHTFSSLIHVGLSSITSSTFGEDTFCVILFAA